MRKLISQFSRIEIDKIDGAIWASDESLGVAFTDGEEVVGEDETADGSAGFVEFQFVKDVLRVVGSSTRRNVGRKIRLPQDLSDAIRGRCSWDRKTDAKENVIETT